MFLLDFTGFIDHMQANYFSELCLPITEVIAFVVGYKYARKEMVGKIFLGYIFFDFTVLIISYFLIITDLAGANARSEFTTITNTLVSLVELIVYYYFFFRILTSSKIKKIMSIMLVTYSIIIIVFLSTRFFIFFRERVTYVSYALGSLEFVFMLVPCFSYINQILKTNSKLSLFERPSFWITTGILFFSIFSIPYYLLYRYLMNAEIEIRFMLAGLFFYAPFAGNFLFLTKAFLCKKTLLT